MKGVDIAIERLRADFVSRLWVGNNTDFYGRCQRTRRKDLVIPEVLNVATKAYKDVLLDDRLDVISFFDVLPNRQGGDPFNAEVWILFAVNLDALFPLITERQTEYAHSAAGNIIKDSEFEITDLVTDLDSFSEYGMVKKTDNMHPWYLFRFNTEIEYELNEC